MRTWTITIPGRPVGKESVRVSAKIANDGHPYVARYFGDKTRNFIATVKLAAQHAGVELVERVKVDIAICLPMNVKHFKTKPDVYSEPLVRPDRDNVSKSIGDALQGILVRDDKHILDGRSYYVWLRNPNAQPKTIITITEVDWKDYIEIERKDGAE